MFLDDIPTPLRFPFPARFASAESAFAIAFFFFTPTPAPAFALLACAFSAGLGFHHDWFCVSNTVTLCSTECSLLKVSLRSAFISWCNSSSRWATFSTATVSLVTISRCWLLLRIPPLTPITRAVKAEPVKAAATSITAQAGVASSLAANPWKPTGLATRIRSRWRRQIRAGS